MVKFKMKVLLALGFSAFMTIMMIFYVSSASGFDIFNLNLRKNDIVVDNIQNNKISWENFFRNPKNQNELVDASLSQTYSLRQSFKSKSSVTKLILMSNRPNLRTNSYTDKFVTNSGREIVSIHQGAVHNKNLGSLFKNISVYNYFLDRRDFMLKQCAKKHSGNEVLHVRREKLDHILVDEKNKVLFCYIPKVACTNWKRMFMLMTGKSNNYSYVINLPSYDVHARNLFASLQNYTEEEINFFNKNYTKLIFVRNPLERLLSAFRNKLEQHYNSSKYFQARFGKYIIKKYRSTPDSKSLLKGDDVTFTEFVRYLVTSPQDEFNEHWQTMNDLCQPCFFKYDLIGKYPSLTTDAQYILNAFNIHHSFPTLPKPSKTASTITDYYKQLPTQLFEQLIQIYDFDFKIFNFTFKPLTPILQGQDF